MAPALDRHATDRVAILFDPHVQAARLAFHTDEVTRRITSPDCDPVLLDRFLIQFCAQGVRMTEPVEGWIRRAGQRTEAVGLTDLGQALQRHALHERDHHLLMISDTHRLVDMWNSLGRPPLDAHELLATPPSPGTVDYVDLHESTIAGDTPYAQIGIEYEIEMLGVTFGSKLMDNVVNVCGRDRLDALSFIAHHVEIDVGHTEFNRRQLDALLADHPEFAGPIACAGVSALNAYQRFIGDCMRAIG